VAVVVVLALAFMIWAAFGENTRYFLTVSEFNSKTEIHDGQMVRVSGKLVEGTFDRGEKSTISHFQLTDKEGENTGAALLLAQYDGVLPDLFFNPHSEIILEGSYSGDGVFHADEILVKCPSKYRDLEDQLDEQPEYGTAT
jgi:cytochrome c-type biogenesis protein CcmE